MKKTAIIFFLISFVCLDLAAQQLNFNQYKTVSENADGFGRPRVVLTANNTPLVIWRKDSSPKVLRASKWNGLGFSPPHDILQQGVLPSSWDGPEIATKGDTVYVVFTTLATPRSAIMLIKSFDGGLSFSDTIRVSENNPTLKFRMANIAINSDGHPIVSYMQYLLNWTQPKQMVNVSFSYGLTFLGATEACSLAPGEPCDCCKSSLVCSGSEVFLLFRNNESNMRNSYIAKSSDGGLTFSSTQDMDDYTWTLTSCPATTPRGALYGDSIVVVKRSGATGNNEVVCSSISTQTLNYSYNHNIDFINGIIQNYPEVSVSGDTVVAVWQDNRGNTQDCYISVSTSGPANLNGSISYTDTNGLGQKIDPDVVFKNGEIHLVYLNNSEHKIVYVKASINTLSNIEEFNESFLNKPSTTSDLLGRRSKKHNTPLIFIDKNGIAKKVIIRK